MTRKKLNQGIAVFLAVALALGDPSVAIAAENSSDSGAVALINDLGQGIGAFLSRKKAEIAEVRKHIIRKSASSEDDHEGKEATGASLSRRNVLRRQALLHLPGEVASDAELNILQAASAADLQNGLVYYYDPAQGTVFPKKSQQLTSKDTSWNDQGEGGGVYVVTGEVTISDTIYLAGDVVLVLEDGCNLTCTGGIVVGGANLTITAPKRDGTGELHVTTRDNDAIAAIGGGNVYNGYRDEQFTGSITINGGVISADASNAGGAGIGGANNWGLCKTYTPGIVTINNGSVLAKGGEGAAGIGGGAKEGGDGTGDIPGIKVRINGGIVEAHGGGNGAGIGGGYEGTVDEIAVQGGEKITAQGGDNGAGIGSGYSGYFNKISIEESTDVTAKGGVGGAGIGSGMIPNWNVKPKYRGEITLKNSKIQASGKAGGAGIGSGMQNSVDTITIDGGTIIAFGGTGGAGIGGGS
jgi:hypothetical protein